MIRGLLLGLLCVALPVSLPASAADLPRTMRLASLDWLPYVNGSLEQEGWSSFVAESAARASGYQIRIEYFPWTRAVQLGSRDVRYAGYFPAYFTKERARSCHFSLPIGSSTIGLAYLKNAPVNWNSVQDLTTLKVGVVAGFSNGPALDAMVREGKLAPDASPSDMLNLRKLLAGRVNAVVIDKLVLRYLLLSEPSIAREREQIAFHDKPLAELPLHICFQHSAEGKVMQQAFNTALQTISLRKLEGEYFQRLERNALQLP
jgi:polar amino acid transport system substrate-binding protein